MNSTTWTEAMLREQLTSYDFEPAEFDLPAMLSRLNRDIDVAWFDLINEHHVARRTAVPCPPYCKQHEGHPFNAIGLEPGEPQSREHSMAFAPGGVAPREDYDGEVSIDLTVPEFRDGTDDSTVRRGDPSVWLHIDGSFTPADVFKLAAALMAAGDKATEIGQ